MRKELRSKGPELLADLARHTAIALTELAELGTEKAEQVGREVADRMATHWGGQLIYVPQGISFKLSKRDREIYDEFNGHNHGDLARKHQVSVQWIYKIVKVVRAEEIAKRQGHLFSEPED